MKDVDLYLFFSSVIYTVFVFSVCKQILNFTLFDIAICSYIYLTFYVCLLLTIVMHAQYHCMYTQYLLLYMEIKLFKGFLKFMLCLFVEFFFIEFNGSHTYISNIILLFLLILKYLNFIYLYNQ